MIVGIVGRSIDPTGAMCSLGAGKDTVADTLVSAHRFQKIGMADPLKRFCQEVYGFTYEQLWGPSEFRNKPDERYPREHTFARIEDEESSYLACECCGVRMRQHVNGKGKQCYLTTRYALKTLGTEWGRNCWAGTWIKKGVDIAQELLEDAQHTMYTPQEGLVSTTELTSTGEWERDDAPQHDTEGVVFSDVRFKNEVRHIREAGGKLLLVLRKVDKVAASAKDMAHQSENDLNEYSHKGDMWDDVIYNNGTLEALGRMTQQALGTLQGVSTIAD